MTNPVSVPGFYNASTPYRLTKVPHSAVLDFDAWVGQRSATYRFDLLDGVTGLQKGQIYPIVTPAQITHDVTRTVKRDLRMTLDHSQLTQIDPLRDRVLPFMIVADLAWPLGRFMFTGVNELLRSGGDDAALTLMDEMNLVDQELTQGFSSTLSCDAAMRALVSGLHLPAGVDIAASQYPAVGAWTAGTARGQTLDALAVQGGLESPWFDNYGVMRSVLVVDAATSVPDFDYDRNPVVFTDSASKTNDILSAPNRFRVVGNGAASSNVEIFGTYDIPPSAPHSIANRGFVIQKTIGLQLASESQAVAAARTIGMTSFPVEQYDLTTPPDPRHDSYQIVRWQGANWLETAWAITCIEGGDMTHTIRRAYV